MKKQIIFIAIGTLLGGYLSAMANDQFLDTCLGIAAARDKRLAVAGEQINLCKVRCLKSARGFFPQIAAERTMETGDTITDQYQSEEFGLRASQTVYEGGRTSYTFRYDKLTLEASRYNYTKVREELNYKIKLAYYEMLSLKMEYLALKKAFDDIEKLNAKVQIEYHAKAISELDLEEAENFHDKTENLIKESEISLMLATKKMTTYVCVESLDDVPVPVPDGLTDDVPEISFTLKDCMSFIASNNLDVRLYQLQVLMADYKRKINRAKAVPKLYVDGFYGKSGEAYVSEPLALTTVWSIAGRLDWTFWGSTFETTQTNEKTVPTQIVSISDKTDSSTLEMKLSLFDDFGYFVDDKESKVGLQQTQADYKEMMDKSYLDLQKAYNDYDGSLRTTRQLKREIELKRRSLDVLRKRNDLYEVPTVQLMEETWKYSDLISSYARAVYQNYASVTEMERLTLITLR
ncbi:MAG: TolC family protein [Endomicrobiales bacterium]|jgi:outer membrane protein TolC